MRRKEKKVRAEILILSAMIALVVSGISVTSADSTRAKEVTVRSGSCDAKVTDCLKQFRKQKMTSDDIKDYIQNGKACFSSDQVILQQQAECFLPTELGTDARNGQHVGIRYFCSDVCPGYGGVILQYVGVQENECCKIGGNPKHDAAWGGYIGCQPKEVPLPQFFWPDEKGVMKLAVRNPCNPSEVTIVGDIPSDWNKRY